MSQRPSKENNSRQTATKFIVLFAVCCCLGATIRVISTNDVEIPDYLVLPPKPKIVRPLIMTVTNSTNLVPITLFWDYPDTNWGLFIIYGTNDITQPLNTWPQIGVVQNTQVTLNVNPGLMYYYVTASNFWTSQTGAEPSNIAYTPSLAHPINNLKITK